MDFSSLMVAASSPDSSPSLPSTKLSDIAAYTPDNLSGQRKWRAQLAPLLFKWGLLDVAYEGVLSFERWLVKYAEDDTTASISASSTRPRRMVILFSNPCALTSVSRWVTMEDASAA